MIAGNQHGYRDKCNTTSALIEMMDYIGSATDANLITASMGIDQSAAFDTVDHIILMEKLGLYGLDKKTMEWIRSYLSNRSSYVAIGSGKSSIRSNKYGVPQGSVMGPLLYLIYINEFGTIIEDDFCVNPVHRDRSRLFGNICHDCGTTTVFADDSIYLFASNIRDLNQERIEDKFCRIRDFLQANGLQINESKTFLSEFMTAQKRVRTKGVPPELTVVEKVENKRIGGTFKLEDKLIHGLSHYKDSRSHSPNEPWMGWTSLQGKESCYSWSQKTTR